MEKKAEIRPRIDLSKEAQYGGIREVSLECAEEKSAVDRPDQTWFILLIFGHIHAKMVYTHSLRHA